MADVALFLEDEKAREWLDKLGTKISQVKDGAKKFGGVISASVFEDIIRHFEQEEGSDGKWKAWSKAYEEHMRSIGKSNNQILQDTGRLRQAFLPTNYRAVSEGMLWYNPAKTRGGFPYAAGHDEGGDGLPKRDFMWLSDKALGKIEDLTLDFILEDR